MSNYCCEFNLPIVYAFVAIGMHARHNYFTLAIKTDRAAGTTSKFVGSHRYSLFLDVKKFTLHNLNKRALGQ